MSQMTPEERILHNKIENWVDELLHYYSKYFQDGDIYLYSDYLFIEAMLDSALSNPFYRGRIPLEVFLEGVNSSLYGFNIVLPPLTQDLITSFNENFKNEPNFP